MLANQAAAGVLSRLGVYAGSEPPGATDAVPGTSTALLSWPHLLPHLGVGRRDGSVDAAQVPGAAV